MKINIKKKAMPLDSFLAADQSNRTLKLNWQLRALALSSWTVFGCQSA